MNEHSNLHNSYISVSLKQSLCQNPENIWLSCLCHMQCPLQAVDSDYWCVSSHCWWPALLWSSSVLVCSSWKWDALCVTVLWCTTLHLLLLNIVNLIGVFFLHKILILVYEQWLILTWYLTWTKLIVHLTVLFCGTWTVVAAVEYTAFSGKGWSSNQKHSTSSHPKKCHFQHSKANVMMIMAHDKNKVILRARVPTVV
jgi:hypothetical protein